ncbi:MAG: hypothetical protein MHM6MM_007339 [Cercozoa sp. M6MM]
MSLYQYVTAAARGHTAAVLACLQAGVPFDAIDRTPSNEQRTALSMACRNGHLEVVELLKQRILQADKTKMHKFLRIDTPLWHAVRLGNVQIAQCLIEIHEFVEGAYTVPHNTIKLACNGCNYPMLHLLTSHMDRSEGASSLWLQRCLLLGTERQASLCVQRLLDLGLEIDCTGAWVNLLARCARRIPDAVCIMLRHFALRHGGSDFDLTPVLLEHCKHCRKPSFELCRLLCTMPRHFEVHPCTKDTDGLNALDYLCNTNAKHDRLNAACVELLFDKLKEQDEMRQLSRIREWTLGRSVCQCVRNRLVLTTRVLLRRCAPFFDLNTWFHNNSLLFDAAQLELKELIELFLNLGAPLFHDSVPNEERESRAAELLRSCSNDIARFLIRENELRVDAPVVNEQLRGELLEDAVEVASTIADCLTSKAALEISALVASFVYSNDSTGVCVDDAAVLHILLAKDSHDAD